jgi:AcrR family transcriptional regulator
MQTIILGENLMNEDKMEGLRQAREQKSLEKRRLVEDAIEQLKSRDETITFKGIATLAGVSRQYLYNNFKDEISSYRDDNRAKTVKIEGVTIPSRTPEESRHVEALLRNKIDRLKKELGTVRHENARLKQVAEKERGRAEHFRRNWLGKNK